MRRPANLPRRYFAHSGKAFFAAALMTLAAASGYAQSMNASTDWIDLSIARVCGRPDMTGLEVQSALPGSWLMEERRLPRNGTPGRILIRLILPGGDELALESRLNDGVLRQFRASLAAANGQEINPVFLAIADGSCTVRSARAIRKGDPPWIFLDQLDGDLTTLRWTEVLQAPWPPGEDPGGVRVAMVDSGLAYDLPEFRDRLARDETGTPVGFDFWDLDPWPYDGDTSRGAFLPIRHGTAVASILVREAPQAALIPYKYPRPDMTRMGDLVERALASDVKILAMPLGSRNAEDWETFAAAIKGQEILAIVSAGNDGRDIDTEPVYPAALDLDNILTVTSADAFGRLARGSNWGAQHVDIMLPAENLSVVDFRGATVVASGSSYAVPRLAALAARLLAEDPNQSVADLKERILSRAVPSPFEREGIVSAGWIADPETD
ncbi:S8 family serine peptidase [uncultured Roseibium sp.]|uniref:S8 family serine peptidase n=1 Tax=uncultured Roseibium sp. TaxID=1936171 RepID=UPI0026317632|nr:S8 family serine peptidase [uncultured Roseibium sp.]